MDYVIVKANIANVAADALVLPANSQLKRGSGVSEVLFDAAGKKELEEECRTMLEATRQLDVGDAVPTSAYKLHARYLIHTVVPKWKDGNCNEYEELSSAFLAALNVADLLHCETIAFPLLASGNNKFDHDLAFEIAKESINSFSGNSLKQVILVIYTSEIASKIKSKGYQYIEFVTPDKKKEKKKTPEKIVNSKDMEKVIKFLNDPKNRKMIIDTGFVVVGLVKAIRKKDASCMAKVFKELK